MPITGDRRALNATSDRLNLVGLPRKLFHTTNDADAIVSEGLRNGTEGYGFAHTTLKGVFLVSLAGEHQRRCLG